MLSVGSRTVEACCYGL